MSEYNIKLEVFEGPMDLLMHLIEKNQIDIYDIPIAIVTEQYLGYLKSLEMFNIDVASEFLLMAATLLQIKSRMLLPRKPQTIEIDEEEDPRQELVDRLLEYRKFKEMSAVMENMLRQREHFFTRLPEEFPVKIPLPEGLNINDLVVAFAAVWESSIDDYELVSREEFSVQDKMYDIIHLLYKYKGKLEFSQTLIRKGTKSEVIASFLALLELVKLQRVIIAQQERFGAINITLKE
ncbi:segregation/condensation protein A [Pelosinus sp. IPA-1]|uniref:segregation and condensation protein A n=1 Tax=Pelosinus sp. IPA-1 TaxID=3029569 RepID=UPI0024361A9C|nr:segregation/condensation protein A [Pelosinus sp. IPA-1]GMA99223.1 segregation and condensation protein A [Pelosinus sp. IPA-1]